MKKIGEIIRDARKGKKYSCKDLEKITKIKSEFITAIEMGNWQNLPTFPTVLGFVKSLSGVLNLDERMAVAVLKRDYPPRKMDINPKPGITEKPAWNPKTTFLLGIVLVVVLILGYLGVQYVNFISPPKIRVESPVEGQMIVGNKVLVFGTTELDAKVTVDNQPVLVDESGKFLTELEVSSSATKIVIKASTRSGKETIVERSIKIE